MKFESKGFSLEDLWRVIVGNPRPTGTPKPPQRAGREEIHDAKFYDIHTGRSIDGENELNQEVVDAILDKINTSGYQSLTDDEKRILNEASKKIN